MLFMANTAYYRIRSLVEIDEASIEVPETSILLRFRRINEIVAISDEIRSLEGRAPIEELVAGWKEFACAARESMLQVHPSLIANPYVGQWFSAAI